MPEKFAAPQERGERLRQARELANLTRAEMCDHPNLNLLTYKGWECGRFGGLSRWGAEHVSERLLNAGVHCSPDWLLLGIGDPPSHHQKTNETDSKRIKTELEVFKAHSISTCDMQITDESMLPQFEPGDTVAGIEINNIADAIGKNVIVFLEDGKILLRKIYLDRNRPKHFLFAATNLASDSPDLVILKAKIQKLALVVWHRKPIPTTLEPL